MGFESYLYQKPIGVGLMKKKKKKTNHLREFASGFFKLFYFTISKPILSFIPYHFTLLSTSQLLFFYSTH